MAKFYIDKSVLEQLYLVDNKSIREISRICKTSPIVIRTRMRKYNITVREKKTPIINKDILENLYTVKRMSVKEIGTLCEIHVYHVQKLMASYGIESRIEGRKWRSKVLSIINKEVLEDLYINKELSTHEIGKIINISPGTVHWALLQYNIQPRERVSALRLRASKV